MINKTFLNKTNNVRYHCTIDLENDEYVFTSVGDDSKPVHLIVLTTDEIRSIMIEDGKSMLKDRLKL